MRIILHTSLFCLLVILASSALAAEVEEVEPASNTDQLLSVDAGNVHSNEARRLARQFGGGFGRPRYGGFGGRILARPGFGGFGVPGFGGGFVRPGFGGFGVPGFGGGFVRPGIGGFGVPGFGGGFVRPGIGGFFG